jgi:hypothetical protein
MMVQLKFLSLKLYPQNFAEERLNVLLKINHIARFKALRFVVLYQVPCGCTALDTNTTA